MPIKLNKNSRIFLIVALVVVLILLITIIYFSVKIKTEKETPLIPVQKEETLIEKQTRELEELRKQANAQPLTEEQIQEQTEELNALRKKSKPLTEEQIQEQTEELNKLRQ